MSVLIGLDPTIEIKDLRLVATTGNNVFSCVQCVQIQRALHCDEQ